MTKPFVRLSCLLMFSAAAALFLGGCNNTICPSYDSQPSIDKATYYDYRSRPDGMDGFREPLNTWVVRPSLTDFLSPTVARGGADQLVSEYGFQCVADSSDAACPSCRTCTKTVATRRFNLGPFKQTCEHWGDIYVQVHVGPDAAVQALTYWKTWGRIEVRAPGGHLPE